MGCGSIQLLMSDLKGDNFWSLKWQYHTMKCPGRNLHEYHSCNPLLEIHPYPQYELPLICFMQSDVVKGICHYLVGLVKPLSFPADLGERQTHHTGTERHRFQLWWHSAHLQSDVQRACRNPTQCQLHCMCHLKGQCETSLSKHALNCISEHQPAFCICSSGPRLPLWYERFEESDQGIDIGDQDNLFLFQFTRKQQWYVSGGRADTRDHLLQLDLTLSCRYT